MPHGAGGAGAAPPGMSVEEKRRLLWGGKKAEGQQAPAPGRGGVSGVQRKGFAFEGMCLQGCYCGFRARWWLWLRLPNAPLPLAVHLLTHGSLHAAVGAQDAEALYGANRWDRVAETLESEVDKHKFSRLMVSLG